MPDASLSPAEALLTAVRRFTRANYGSNKTITSGELSQAEWYLLSLLQNWPEQKGAQPSHLAQRLRVTAGSVAQQLRHLEQLGLIARTHDSADKRVVLVKLTARGRKSLTRLRAEFLQHYEELIAHLGPGETRHFTDLLLATAEFLESQESASC